MASETDSFIKKNLVWVIITLVTLGSIIATVKINRCVSESNDKRLTAVEMNVIKLDRIETDISDIKADVKDIKKIILKPAFEVAEVD